jgi:hypothetical protein
MPPGSVAIGTVDGLAKGAHGSGLAPAGLTFVNATPEDQLTCQTGSDIAFDILAGEYYMGLAQNGSTWIHLVSGT